MTKKLIESAHTWKFQLYFSAKQSTKFVCHEDLVFSFMIEQWGKKRQKTTFGNPDTEIFGRVKCGTINSPFVGIWSWQLRTHKFQFNTAGTWEVQSFEICHVPCLSSDTGKICLETVYANASSKWDWKIKR